MIVKIDEGGFAGGKIEVNVSVKEVKELLDETNRIKETFKSLKELFEEDSSKDESIENLRTHNKEMENRYKRIQMEELQRRRESQI